MTSKVNFENRVVFFLFTGMATAPLLAVPSISSGYFPKLCTISSSNYNETMSLSNKVGASFDLLGFVHSTRRSHNSVYSLDWGELCTLGIHSPRPLKYLNAPLSPPLGGMVGACLRAFTLETTPLSRWIHCECLQFLPT